MPVFRLGLLVYTILGWLWLWLVWGVAEFECQ